MIIYVQHATLAREYPAIKRLIAEYGLVGYAFYWEAVEMMGLNEGWHWLSHLLSLRYNKLPLRTIEQILRRSGLFEVNDAEGSVVTLSQCVKQPIQNLEESVFVTCRASRPWARKGTPDRVHADTPDRGAHTDSPDPAPDGVRTGPFDTERLRLQEECEAEQALNNFLSTQCPSLLQMAEPLTLEQYQLLRKRYDRADIEQVLHDMHNDLSVVQTRRSCYGTARRWLEHRSR